MLLVVAFNLDPLGELVWLTSDLIELPKGYGKGHEVVFHFANQLAHLFDKYQVFFCLLMFLFLTACSATGCCCWLSLGSCQVENNVFIKILVGLGWWCLDGGAK